MSNIAPPRPRMFGASSSDVTANLGAHTVLIKGSGFYTPPASITNDELVDSFNRYIAGENSRREALGEQLLEGSSAVFIEEASGIRKRHVLDKEGILDADVMVPRLKERPDAMLSIQAEFALQSARLALDDAGLAASDIDLVICSCAHHQRPYPAIAIEIQRELGCGGAAFDMNVACSSTTFATHVARQMVLSGAATNVLVCSPEIMSGHLNYRDRKTHFIFGDASASLIVGSASAGPRGTATTQQFEILESRIWTKFSSNIRSNFGFLNRTAPETASADDKLVTQVGNKVFRDIVIAASDFIEAFLRDHSLSVADLDRLWLHQANVKMLRALLRQLSSDKIYDRVPIILGEIGNVASPGSLIAFHQTKNEVSVGGTGIICSFGAGYSIGGILVRRIN